jgi:hypothetical protein
VWFGFWVVLAKGLAMTAGWALTTRSITAALLVAGALLVATILCARDWLTGPPRAKRIRRASWLFAASHVAAGALVVLGAFRESGSAGVGTVAVACTAGAAALAVGGTWPYHLA